jgi:DNA-binding CsgD family transcriptional regulator/tetratricopeptide (TPR) repeat protein
MGRSSQAGLIGRDGDLERLADAFRVAAAGTPRVVILGGEAGIGKTRLLDAFSRQVTAQGGRALLGGCLDLAASGLPLLPLAEILRGLVRTEDPARLDALLGAGRRDLARLVPELDDEADAHPDPIQASRLFEIVLGLVGRMAADRPTLLAVEDVHWIDPAARDLCSFLVRNLRDERVLLVLTYRSDDLVPANKIVGWLAGLARHERAERMELRRLDRPAVARQAAAMLGGTADPALVDEIWRRSDGNPYFVEELVASRDAGQGRPDTLIEILGAHLAQLTEATRRLLGAMAIGGRSIREELVAEVTDQPIELVRTSLRELVEQRIIEREDAERGQPGFRHALLREVAIAELLPGERRALHERYAIALTARPELGDPSPAGAAAELAHHWEAAGRVDEAYGAAVRAGEAAAAVAAYDEAARQLAKAIDLLEQLPRPPEAGEKVGLLRNAADAADLAGDVGRALALTRSALALTDATADPQLAGLLHSRIGYLLWASGDANAGLEAHRRAVELVPAKPSSAARAQVLGAIGAALMGVGRYAESREVCEEAIRCAAAVGATSHEARARNMLGSDLVGLGEVDAGLNELRRSRDLAQRGGPPELLVVAHHNLALNLAQAGDHAAALAEAQEGRQAARRLGLERRFGMDLAALSADVLIRLGRWDEAASTLAEGLALDPAGRGTVYLAATAARLAALSGDLTAARERLAVAEELATGELDADLAAYLARTRAEVAQAEDRPDAVLAAVVDGLDLPASAHDLNVRPPLLALGLRATADLAETARARRDGDALERARSAAEPLTAGLDDVPLEAYRALGDGERSRVDGVLDPTAWDAAASALDLLPDPHLAAYARYRAAEAALRAGARREEVGARLRVAHGAAVRMGAAQLVDAARTLARRGRIELGEEGAGPVWPEPAAESVTKAPVARVAPPAGGLSPREIEVIRLVAMGRTNGEIAQELFISRKTAAVHVTHILDKLGVANRVEAAMAATRLGLVPAGEE